MRVITINVPESILNCLDKLTRLGITPSRSAAIRQLIILGWEQWIKRLESIQEIIKIREDNHNPENVHIKVPKKGEYFSPGDKGVELKVIRRLE